VAYYYLVASLPRVTLDEAPPMDAEAFLTACESMLTPDDLADLRRALEGDAAGAEHPFLRQWAERETQLRNEVARARAAARRVDAAPHQRATDAFDVATVEVATHAAETRDPLERERLLDRHRWQTIDDLVGPSSFEADAVFGFALKLRMSERWAAMSEERGREKVRQCVEALAPGDEADAAT